MFYEVMGDEPVSPQRKAAVQEILEKNEIGKNFIFTSVITHLEIVPSKLDGKKAGAELKYMSAFDGSRLLDYEISANILRLAREIKNFYFRNADEHGKGGKMMDSADAIHLATAIVYSADEFHTRDNDHKGSKVPLVSLYAWSGISKVCGKYDLKIVCPESDQGALPFEGIEGVDAGIIENFALAYIRRHADQKWGRY